MNIALVGYGKMGQAIEKIALSRGHNIVLRIRTENKHEFTPDNLRMADVVIEFTRPDAAKENVEHCLKQAVPVVCGTTGWSEGLEHAKLMALQNHTALLWASNFSVGVNIFFEINKHLAALMNDQPDYDVIMDEVHHIHKKDSPSGTAITIAEQILDNLERKKHWVKGEASDADQLAIIDHREGEAPGTHSVKYTSAVDDVEIIHKAHNREGFALGAVLAAEFLAGKQGIYTMKDVLGITSNR